MLREIIFPTFVLLSMTYVGYVHASARAAIDDTAITTAIKTKLLGEEFFAASDIKISTNGGIVRLSGNVKTQTAAIKIVEIAAATKGTKEVDVSSLTVAKRDKPNADAMITAKIRGLIVREAVFGDTPLLVSGIHIETKEGLVYLSGKLYHKTQEETIIHLAKLVCGVKDVHSSLELTKDTG